ncbi:MAG: hypothetical protein HY714_00895 [Candidatus Omnitrophica bacterium]|nr:hypothetical protein [Candidatus Omnitrophota bacterium]
MTRFKAKNQKGVALVATLGLISMMSILSVSLMAGSLVEIQSAERFENRMFAFHLAEGALDQTISTLRTNRAYAGVPSTGATNGSATGTYRTTVTQSQSNPNLYTIAALGTVGATAASAGYQERNITALYELPAQTGGGTGLFSNTSIQLSGNVETDAYDSRNGAYAPATASSEGHIATNTIRAGFVMMSGNVNIKGNATVGPNGNPLSVITMSGYSKVWGTKSAAASLRTLTPVAACNNPTALSVAGNDTVSLAAGTHCFSSISVTGNGRLNVSGTATLTVNGNVNIAGNGVGTSGNLPPNLTINVSGSRSVAITGNGNFYGKVYAPQSSVNINGNGEFFGSFTGNSVAMSGNGKIHYDKALDSDPGSQVTGNDMKSWTEVWY